jgi:hypothetical protein
VHDLGAATAKTAQTARQTREAYEPEAPRYPPATEEPASGAHRFRPHLEAEDVNSVDYDTRQRDLEPAYEPEDEPSPVQAPPTSKRSALVACFNAGGLNKKDGAWHGAPGDRPVSGTTTADLARDGMLTVTTKHRNGSARLTERGNWFARTLLCNTMVVDNLNALDAGS